MKLLLFYMMTASLTFPPVSSLRALLFGTSAVNQ